ncbi:hypothetical protein PR048_015705 [Dryococelus australis]|uniref:Uncharacterized protein n=1 Tax=Dryococelus australis TaxID=614101 RepID=A0ABQ9HHV1_9NEOP|nr:hypothetical protein PR048_015705 [Dryococelus australis]
MIKILGRVQQSRLQGFLQEEDSQKYQSHSSSHQKHEKTVITREAPLQTFEGSVMTRNIGPLPETPTNTKWLMSQRRHEMGGV